MDTPVWGIIGAMEEELSTLKKESVFSETVTIADMEFCVGTLHGAKLVLVQSGMGKVNAAICAQILISRFGVNRIINTGVAGSLDARIDIGDIVVSVDAVQHDFDVSPIGFARAEIPYTGLRYFPADEGLRQAALRAIRKAVPEIGVFEGSVCSGDQFIASREAKDQILSNFSGLCCEMEGAAIAQTCYLNHVPFVILRAISDKADDSEEVAFETFKHSAAQHCAAVIQCMLAENKA